MDTNNNVILINKVNSKQSVKNNSIKNKRNRDIKFVIEVLKDVLTDTDIEFRK